MSYLVERWDVLNGLQNQVTTKVKSSPDDCSGRARITFAANFLYFLYFHPPSELISGWALHIYIYIYQHKQHFYKQRQAKIGRNQEKAEQHPEAELLVLENYSFSSFSLSCKINMIYSEKCTKNNCILVYLFRWDYVINSNKNESENKKWIT